MAGMHKFFCVRCDRHIYGEDTVKLSVNLNHHATTFHPSDFSNWTGLNILESCHYSPPPSNALPQYTQPFGTTSRAGTVLPALTDEDKDMLVKAHIKWD